MANIAKYLTDNLGYTGQDIKSLLWNALIIGVSACVTYILEHVKLSMGLDPILETAIVTFIVKALNKLVVDTSAK